MEKKISKKIGKKSQIFRPINTITIRGKGEREGNQRKVGVVGKRDCRMPDRVEGMGGNWDPRKKAGFW